MTEAGYAAIKARIAAAIDDRGQARLDAAKRNQARLRELLTSTTVQEPGPCHRGTGEVTGMTEDTSRTSPAGVNARLAASTRELEECREELAEARRQLAEIMEYAHNYNDVREIERLTRELAALTTRDTALTEALRKSIAATPPWSLPGQVAFEEYDRATREALELVTRERDEAQEKLARMREDRDRLNALAGATDTLTARLGRVADGYARLCREFTAHAQSGMSARISLTVLNRHRATAELDALPPGSGKHNPYTDLDAENDRLRSLLYDIIRTSGETAVIALAVKGVDPQS